MYLKFILLLLLLLLLVSNAGCQQRLLQQALDAANNNGGISNDNESDIFEYHDEIDHLKEIEGVHWTAASDSPPVKADDDISTPQGALHPNQTSDNSASLLGDENLKNESVIDNKSFNDQNQITSSNNTTKSLAIKSPSSSSGPYDSHYGNNNDVILARTHNESIFTNDGSEVGEGRNKADNGDRNRPKNEDWEDEEFFLSGDGVENKELVQKALNDGNVSTWRDVFECKYALNTFRRKADTKLLVHSWNMSDLAEKWAVVLAYKVENLAKDDRHMIYMNRHLEQDKGFGMLVYYAENIPQGPGCNMAIVAFLQYVFFFIILFALFFYYYSYFHSMI